MKLEKLKKEAETFAWSAFWLAVGIIVCTILVAPVWMLVALLGD